MSFFERVPSLCISLSVSTVQRYHVRSVDLLSKNACLSREISRGFCLGLEVSGEMRTKRLSME